MNEYSFILDQMKWSYSRLECYERCPYCFYLQYILKKQSQSGFFGQYGSFAHELLEKYYKNELFIFELSKEFENNYTSKITAYAPPNKFCDLSAKYFQQGKDYFDSFQGLEEQYEVLGVEQKYDYNIGEFNFAGIIDLELKHKDGWLELIDHKSKSKLDKTRISKKENKDNYIKTTDNRYIPFSMIIQLYLYCIPFYDKYREYPKYLNFNMFKIQDLYKIEFNKEDFEKSKKWAIDIINNIYDNEKWNKGKVESFWCSYTCSVNQDCTYSDRYLGL
jgi:hypothetical protein